jgi:hypothetical protein
MNPVVQPQQPVAEIIRTRSGYAVADAVRSFKMALEESGAVAAGKSIHYTADLVCSGCFEIWQKMLWDYALDHIGISSPRIFHFLMNRFTDLQNGIGKMPSENFYKTSEYQNAMAECVLVVRSCPRRPALKMPKVPPGAHTDEWIRTTTMGTNPSAAVGKVFNGTYDLQVVKRVGDEFAKACNEGATEKAIFWMKWLLEEDARLKKDGKGSLSNMDRGHADWPSKFRSHIGFFVSSLLIELYKELAAKQAIRMHDEFKAILQLYSIPKKQLSQKRRQDLLCLAIQIICEVPRWKLPAAPSLVKDPLALERAIAHAESFFREVLAYDPPVGDLAKEAKKSGKPVLVPTKTSKQLRQMNVEEHLAAYDAVIDQWMNGKG